MSTPLLRALPLACIALITKPIDGFVVRRPASRSQGLVTRQPTPRSQHSMVRGAHICSVQMAEGGHNAVVVGAGPAGLASAFVLAERGFDVTVVERRREESMYEAQRAYLYLVDGRGQEFTDMASITPVLAAVSVASTNYTVMRLMPDGNRITSVPPILEPAQANESVCSYWVPRQTLIHLLAQRLREAHGPRVTTFYGTSVTEITRSDDGGVQVTLSSDADGEGAKGMQRTLRPTLLVGADGLRSAVRAKCAEWSGEDETLGAKRSDFVPVQLPSESTGLCYKMLRLPPQFRLSREDSQLKASPRQAYSVRPSPGAPLGAARLGMLPVADSSYPRTANVILPADHAVWSSLSTAEQVFDWLQATFPQLPMQELISTQEAQAFCDGAPGVFPAPCYSPRQQLLLPEAGVVLVGDAVHAFPPDIGQGVNSALQDVVMLASALDGAAASTGVSASAREDQTSAQPAMALLRKALPAYEQVCAREAECVARIAQIGFPFQYNQGPKGAQFLWFANFALRTFVLSKVAPAFFSPAAIVLVLRPHLRYSEVWALAQQTTRRLRATLAVVVATLVWPLLRRAMSNVLAC